MNVAASLLAMSAAVGAVLVAGAALRTTAPPRSLPSMIREGEETRAMPRPRQHRLIAVALVVALPSIVVILPDAGPGVIVLVGAGAAVVMTRRRRRTADRRRAIEAAMPDATELLVACLHAGRSPTQGIVELARLAPLPVRPAFAAVEQRMHRGQGLADALTELTQRCGRIALPLVTAMSAAVRDGLPLAPVLDRLSDDANASRRRQGEASARRLPVRLSFPLVACTLPSFVLLSIAPAILGALSSLRGSPL